MGKTAKDRRINSVLYGRACHRLHLSGCIPMFMILMNSL